MNIKLQDEVNVIPGVGPEVKRRLNTVGIKFVSDIIDYWPRRYEDYSKVVLIKDCIPGPLTIKAKFSSVKSKYVRRGMHITEAIASDSSGALKVVWFNQPYRAKSLKISNDYYISGNFDVHSGSLAIANPTLMESNNGEDKNLILPIYPETKEVNSALIRRLMKKLQVSFSQVKETLPEEIIINEKLISKASAVKSIHLPDSNDELQLARERLAFEELFQMQLSSLMLKNEIRHEKASVIEFDLKTVQNFLKDLPFELTIDQKQTLWQIYKDLERDIPMNRLVEGDVGSGKTVVAALSSLLVMKHGYQVLFMAPTEILAQQHANTLNKLFSKTEYSDSVGLLTGSLKPSAKKLLHQKIKNGDCRLIVGTQALIQDSVATNNVGLVIVDEQHRFGVNQRQKLRQKAGIFPHFLAMTATPIPRSLALTLYGEVDLSTIESMPGGRKETITEIIPFAARHSIYQKIDSMISEGNQIYIVCPLIQESESLDVQAVETLYKEISTKQLKDHKVAMLHGKLKNEEKDQLMNDFRSGDIKVLVATTVIEVGVDVPNANIILIEGAERFGLAQIHQLRGRVGRAGAQGYCYLIPSQDIGETRRLKAVASTSSGFKLAELDLELRGPGAIYGTRQSGLLDLRIARFDDRKMLLRAKRAAEWFIETNQDMLKYGELSARVKHFQSLTKLN